MKCQLAYCLTVLLFILPTCLFVEIPKLNGVVNIVNDKIGDPFNTVKNLTDDIPNIKDTVNEIVDPLRDIKDTVGDKIVSPIKGIEDVVADGLIDVVYNGLVLYEKTRVESPALHQAALNLKVPKNILRRRFVPDFSKFGVCVGCAAAAKYFILRSRLGLSRNVLAEVLVFVCSLFSVESDRVCRGAIELNIDILIYIVKENKQLDAKTLCATVFQSFKCFQSRRPDWSIYVPFGDAQKRFTGINLGKDVHRILQITDFHLDPLYKEGSRADCSEALCCQIDSGNPLTSEGSAGKWGDYRNCDPPYIAVENLFDQLKVHNQSLQPGISYIYFTGDIISHRIWETSEKSNSGELSKLYKYLRQNFPRTPIFPILGNHEVHPVNVFAPLEVDLGFSNAWLYNLVAEEWSYWLPESAIETIRRGGFYTVLVKPGFRIIALNSNVCYIFNWWLLYNPKDQFDQLAWLSQVLTNAEANNESVHILSHVPPGDSTCLQAWTRQYRRIVERFSTTITGQFNGHTHFDEFRIFYNSSNAVNIAYNGGSFTPFSNLNPNYRIYDVDSQTHELLNYEEWMYNLEEANSEPGRLPNWYKLYSFREAYGVKSLKADDVDGLIQNMRTNNLLLSEYNRYKVREAKPAMLQGCEEDCQMDNLCNILSIEADEAIECGSTSLV